MIDIDGKYYIIDMDAVMKWVAETPNSEKNINTITTMTYPIIEGEEMVEKEISETKSNLNEIMNNVRYDFVRILLNTLFTTFTTELNQVLTFSFKDLSFAQKIAFNTLMAKKIITEVTDFNND
jgi:hypothetical protein